MDMKKICILCGSKKGKRTCRIHGNAAICPVCCATTRHPSCEGCRYYALSQQYQASKAHDAGSKHFIAEFSEGVFNEVDRALILCEQGSFQKAFPILQKLLAAHPRNHQVCYGMGVYHAIQGNYDEALTYLNRATDIFPHFVEAHFNKGTVFRKKMDIKNMVKSYQTVIKIGDPEADTVKQAKDLLHEFEQHLRVDGNTSLDSYLKGQDLFDQAFEAMDNQKWEQAISLFQQCSRYCPRHPQSYGNMGICYGKLGQNALALQAFDMALEIDPNYEPAIINRAVAESLHEEEKFPQGRVETIEYYKEYAANRKSYIQTLIEQGKKLQNHDE